MPQDLTIVQFLHPGPEHRPDHHTWKSWNQSAHRRTFVQQPGQYLRSVKDSPSDSDNLQFWCEWECQAKLLRTFPNPKPEYPKYLFQPYWQMPSKFNNHANTDPCVFGDSFRYCVCQQPSRPSLKQLAPGSLILFGSYLGGKFILDTLFVVASRVQYDSKTYPQLGLPSDYVNIAIKPILAGSYCGSGNNFQLYEGATFANQIEGMFSFFPAQNGGNGFPRPSINLPPYVNTNHKQGIKRTVVSLTALKNAWHLIVAQITERGLSLGVQADMPAQGSPPVSGGGS